MNLGRDARAAGLGQPFQPRGDVHALAVDVLPFADHVAEVDANAKHDPLSLGQRLVRLRHLALKLERAGHCVHRTAELDQDTVADDFDDAPAVRPDGRLKNGRASLLQGRERAGFVRLHEAAVSHDVSHHHGGQAAFHVCHVPPAQDTSLLRGDNPRRRGPRVLHTGGKRVSGIAPSRVAKRSVPRDARARRRSRCLIP